jgi:hypothetical protein
VKIISILPLILIGLYSCSRHECHDLKNEFESNKKYIETVEKTRFKFQDKLFTSDKSWINEISFFSCDGNSGFLIVTIGNKKYLYSEVTSETWFEFKNCESFGKYYNFNIKGKYKTSFSR